MKHDIHIVRRQTNKSWPKERKKEWRRGERNHGPTGPGYDFSNSICIPIDKDLYKFPIDPITRTREIILLVKKPYIFSNTCVRFVTARMCFKVNKSLNEFICRKKQITRITYFSIYQIIFMHSFSLYARRLWNPIDLLQWDRPADRSKIWSGYFTIFTFCNW